MDAIIRPEFVNRTRGRQAKCHFPLKYACGNGPKRREAGNKRNQRNDEPLHTLSTWGEPDEA